MIICERLIMKELQHEFDNIGFSHYCCAAHVLNLAAKQELEIIDSSAKKVQSLMSKIKVSTHLCDDLHGLCQLKGIPYLKPKLNVDTRWNSTYYMLQKMQKMETALRLVVADHLSIHALYLTINKQLSLNIQDFLDTYIEQNEFSQKMVAASIHQKIEKYWIIMDKSSVVFTILNPCAKLKMFSKTEAIDAKKTVQEIMDQYVYKYQKTSISMNIEDNLIKTARKIFWNLHNKWKLEELPTIDKSSTTDISELDRYIRMASDYLSIQATSIAYEQAFSIASNTISRTRNRLHSKTARACLCVKSWISNGIGEIE
ncbi:2106_t:CDS:2 [Cetraspora pellucida]|uniref:2106_t:CDS:1 n=1 Tax=Cetraspora pellucida TaxID=1433469 RepID=A0A9N9IUF1_9GLOM|nr:2106_t:CDS:2 [Cetraspora pellucida]